jgi:hypothetical protein
MHGCRASGIGHVAHTVYQAESFAREGVNLETSTLSGRVGTTAVALKSLIDALAADMMVSGALYVDARAVPVLPPGTGKTKTGRLGTYCPRREPFAGSRRRRRCSFYSPDRKGRAPQEEWSSSGGADQAGQPGAAAKARLRVIGAGASPINEHQPRRLKITEPAATARGLGRHRRVLFAGLQNFIKTVTAEKPADPHSAGCDLAVEPDAELIDAQVWLLGRYREHHHLLLWGPRIIARDFIAPVLGE